MAQQQPKTNLNNLGSKVSTRNIQWADLCQRSWGSEFFAPDHGVFEFSDGRKFDSTDTGYTGLYTQFGMSSAYGNNYLMLFNSAAEFRNKDLAPVSHLTQLDGSLLILE